MRTGLLPHLLVAGLVLLPAVSAAAQSVAQAARQLHDDIDTFRSVLGPAVALNVTQVTPDAATFRVQLACNALPDLPAGPPRTAHVAQAQYLAYAVLCSGSLADAFGPLGVTFASQLLSHEAWHAAGEPLLVRRLGTASASIAVEPGIARPRQYQIRTSEGLWSVDVTSYLPARNAWYPQTLIVRLDETVVLRWAILDAATSADQLPPLPGAASPAAPAVVQRQDVRFPYLPL